VPIINEDRPKQSHNYHLRGEAIEALKMSKKFQKLDWDPNPEPPSYALVTLPIELPNHGDFLDTQETRPPIRT